MSISFFADGAGEFAELAAVLFVETAKSRGARHRAAGQRGCPARTPLALWPSSCVACGCADVFSDVLTRVAVGHERREAKPLAEPVVNLPGYVRIAGRHALTEDYRESQSRRGVPAKATASDGVPGRIVAALTAQHEPWLVMLFDLVRRHVAGGGGQWPWQDFADAKGATDGRARTAGQGARRELADDLGRLRAVVVQVGGPGWWHDTIVLPLRAGQPVSLDAGDRDGHRSAVQTEIERAAATSAEPAQAAALLRGQYGALRAAGASPADAVVEAVFALTGQTVSSRPGSTALLTQLAADWEVLYREQQAGAELHRLLAGSPSVPSPELLAELRPGYQRRRAGGVGRAAAVSGAAQELLTTLGQPAPAAHAGLAGLAAQLEIHPRQRRTA